MLLFIQIEIILYIDKLNEAHKTDAFSEKFEGGGYILNL